MPKTTRMLRDKRTGKRVTQHSASRQTRGHVRSSRMTTYKSTSVVKGRQTETVSPNNVVVVEQITEINDIGACVVISEKVLGPVNGDAGIYSYPHA